MLTLTLKRTVVGNFDFCLLVLGTQYRTPKNRYALW